MRNGPLALIVAAIAVAVVAGLLLAGRSTRPAPGTAPGTWITAQTPPDEQDDGAVLDLRDLNERKAGDGGFIGVRDGHFVQLATGTPNRFWGVNASPVNVEGASLGAFARMLARRGVNLVRLHAP